MLRMQHGRRRPPAVLTGEDLCILGPVALLQDLAMMALLGIGHVERNGHHYYRGLSMLPRVLAGRATLAAHGDIYAAPRRTASPASASRVAGSTCAP